MIGINYNFELALAKIHIFSLKIVAKPLGLLVFINLNLNIKSSLIRINIKQIFLFLIT